MKEATGELNAAVVVILAISVFLAFFYYTLWPLIKNNFTSTTKCNKAICEKCPSSNCDYVTCHLPGKSDTFECIYKG